MLLSRSEDKLQEKKAELNKEFSTIEVETIQADFSQYDAKMYDRIRAALAGRTIGILVRVHCTTCRTVRVGCASRGLGSVVKMPATPRHGATVVHACVDAVADAVEWSR